MPKTDPQISIILVEPIYAGNVGAVARIMNNFCFSDLRIVGSVPEKNDFYLAMHSEHILENASIFPDLASAIAGLDRVIAFSRRRGKNKPIDLSPPEMAAYVHEIPELKIGLVFGRETYGLTDEEADLCPLRCHFSANPAFPSINLAQAVALAIYEVASYPSRGLQTGGKSDAVEGEELNKIYAYIMEVLSGIGYFSRHETTNWDVFLKKMLAQLNPNKEMVYRLRQMFNRIHVLVTGKGKGYD
ncbi:MAG TPA: TrmH family RNA methyltransferase [Candidatus Cloacimonadota bacterium]|jgi:tRNA/rRNA methyltransferase|nr:TrmH family RNA methyltransferase [Candidatus Cloacimonadota bacterium]MDD4100460.1 TrmH family RNA methyltransferase [Candidatus Cloacimonadota bacterium]MDD4806429.1 TrmH family RNA methyltransferase [Candidatus Cloacimonadota bacterium]HOA29506.1 TrmH family RNA methyltransferase [Candidatus Cloacimonadota bacterium]